MGDWQMALIEVDTQVPRLMAHLVQSAGLKFNLESEAL
jgi:hypothetical protein